MCPKFETTTWQLLACVLTQLAIDLVAAERKTWEVWVESQPDPSFPHFFTPPILSRLVLLTESLNIIWISVWDFSDLVSLPPPLPWEKRTQERGKSWPISWSTFCQTGLERVLKTWKVLQFYFDIFQNQKVLEEKDYRPWKNRSEPGKILEIFSVFFSSFLVSFSFLIHIQRISGSQACKRN